MSSDRVGQLGDTASGGAIRKLVVCPERAQHLGKVRLTASVKTGYPNAWLLIAAAQVVQELVEDGFQTLFVLAIADKGFVFLAKHALGCFRMVLGHFRDTVVDKSVFSRKLDVDIPIQHVIPHHSLFHQ